MRGWPPSRRLTRSSASTRSTATSSGWTAISTRRSAEAAGEVDSALQDEAAWRASWDSSATFIDTCRSSVAGHPFRAIRRAFIRGRYLAGVARAIARAGGTIYEHSEAEEFREIRSASRRTAAWVTCDGHRDRDAQSAASACADRPARHCSRPSSRCTPATWWPGACRAATSRRALLGHRPIRTTYLRLEAHRRPRLVIFGGEDHKTGQVRTPARATIGSSARLATMVPGDRADAPLVGAGHRDTRRSAVHRRNGRPSVRGDRVSPATG